MRSSGKWKITADDDDDDDDSVEHLSVSDSDSDSDLSDSESSKVSMNFAEEFLSYGIHCKDYFWQYNRQSRGPKARRVFAPLSETDFHILRKCIDPVIERNDLPAADHSNQIKLSEENRFSQPDPEKLLLIGSRIEKMENKYKLLSTNNNKMKSSNIGKEKNKIASRICRLRRKAQHESNKIKLKGLDKEHGQLMQVCVSILLVLDCFFNQLQHGSSTNWQEKLSDHLKAFISKYLSFMVAGYTASFVNKELATAAETIIAENRKTSVVNQT